MSILTKKTDMELLQDLSDLRKARDIQLGQIANTPGTSFNGIKQKDFLAYIAKPETQELFRSFKAVKAELRARGFKLPTEFPETE